MQASNEANSGNVRRRFNLWELLRGNRGQVVPAGMLVLARDLVERQVTAGTIDDFKEDEAEDEE